MNTHPTAGRRYIHVFPRSAFFSEIKDCYDSACKRIPWITVEDLDGWSADRIEWQMPELILIFWGLFPESVPERRRAGFVLRFTESVGDPELLAENQVRSMTAFAVRAKEPDLLLCGNPTVADYWSRLCRAVGVAPIGYEREVLGAPVWDVPKRYQLCFRGSPIERRIWLTDAIREAFGRRFLWIGTFGKRRKEQLDECMADLYLGHSSDYAFPGMRLWQDIASSAALISERRDAWPAKDGRHYVSLKPAVESNIRRFLVDLNEILTSYPLRELAKTAHLELSSYTIDRCMEEFVVPATKGLGG